MASTALTRPPAVSLLAIPLKPTITASSLQDNIVMRQIEEHNSTKAVDDVEQPARPEPGLAKNRSLRLNQFRTVRAAGVLLSPVKS